MTKKDEQDQVDEVKKLINEALGRSLAGVAVDAEDYDYIMAKALLRAHDLKLTDNDVYKDGKLVGRMGNLNYDGKNFDMSIQWLKSLHYVTLSITLDGIKVLKK